jgi:hypothetical protein
MAICSAEENDMAANLHHCGQDMAAAAIHRREKVYTTLQLSPDHCKVCKLFFLSPNHNSLISEAQTD